MEADSEARHRLQEKMELSRQRLQAAMDEKASIELERMKEVGFV